MHRHFTPALTLFLAFGFASIAQAQAPPGWWAERGATNANPPNDHAVVTQGQLKHFTQKAVDELNARIPGGAGTDLNNLVQNWTAGHPDPSDFHAMTVGQLKFVANLVRGRLVATGQDSALPAWLVASPGANEIVNIGQLKTVFNYYLEPEYSSNGNGLPDAWQLEHFGHTGVDPSGDADGDGLTNLQEYLVGTNPDKEDSDGDGIQDDQEIVNGTDPLDAAALGLVLHTRLE